MDQIDPGMPSDAARAKLTEPFLAHCGKLLVVLFPCVATSEDVMNVSTWLQGLGLERHEAAFRDNDLGVLFKRWQRAQAGAGQFIQIVGKPGLGKSRLIPRGHSG
jgi:hypothetical protein